MTQTPAGDLDLLSIGEVLVDLISLEESDTLREAYTFRKYLGGSPANIAVNVAKLGGRSAVISKTGIGAFGGFLKSELRRAGVSTEYLVMDHRVNTSVIFISRTAGTPDFEAFRSGDYQLAPHEIPEAAIERAKLIHASTFSFREPCRSAVEQAFKMAAQHGKIISLDPNYSPLIWPDFSEARVWLEKMLGYASITKPSLDDAIRIFGADKTPEEYISLFHELGPELVVFTMGAKGIMISQAGEIIHIPARPVNVVDVTGAGDSFWAGFLVAYLDGKPLEMCGLFAREIVETKLTAVGPLPDLIVKQAIYDRLHEPD